ncbi:snare-like protein [Cystobasidium minutum MCA 4210]|uniref:snare-like protein n=1 Tax=Cystobasidium minutum MCA 4210 TaxID=1397322 RepID=UPI0034CD247F|eukprot:jgi/Rhomi1/170968/fgenesh1_kg.4_\
MTNLGLYSVTAIILLDSAGNCILSKYYEPLHPSTLPSSEQKKATGPNATGSALAVPTLANRDAVQNSLQGYANPFKTTKDQRAFEKGLFDKTRKGSGDIILYNNQLCLYKSSIDVTFYVVGPEYENEIMLQNVLIAFHDAVSLLLRHSIEKRSVLENLDLVVLALDETVDDGIILETDSTAIASRCSRPRPDPALNLSELKIDEQSLLAAFSTVRDRVVSKIGQM